jgi:hypothetical protein
LTGKLCDWSHDELDEATWEWLSNIA